MAIVSSGQLSLTDLNDGKQMMFSIAPSVQQQIYNPNGSGSTAYAPDFTTTNLVISPQLYIAGVNGTNLMPNGASPVTNTQIKSITWYEGATDAGTVIASHTTSSNTAVSTTDYTVAGGNPQSVDKKLTVKTNFTAKVSQSFTCKVVYTDPDTGFDVPLVATREIVKLTNGLAGGNGTNSLTAFPTNSAVTLPATTLGAVSVFTGSGTDIYVYDGSTTLKYVTTTPANGEYNIATSISPASGVTLGAISLSGTSASNNQRATVANITAFATANDVVTVTYTITGKTLTGTAINTAVTQTFTKSKAGTDATFYSMSSSAEVIQKNASGTTAPATLTFTGFTTVGSGMPSSVANGYKFVVDTSVSGGAFSNNVATPTTGASVSFTTNVANLSAVRCRLYPASVTPSTTNWVDEQTIYVVSDGQDYYSLNVWTPNGEVIQNGMGSLTIQADMYKGSTLVTPTAFKWYIQDGTVTSGSPSTTGGDADGGGGWRLLLAVADATTAPTLAMVANANTQMSAIPYFVKYTWTGLSGETIGSTEATITLTAGQDLRVTIPAFPTNALSARVYVGTATGNANLKYQGTISTSAGNLVLSAFDPNGELIPTASTASTSAISGATLTVRPNGIANIEGYKVVATAPNNGKYSGVAIVRDQTDPIVVDVQGDQIFRNGTGSVTLTARLLRNGAQISTAGYTFSWTTYNSNGTVNTVISGQTGATCVVSASMIDGKGYIVCDAIK
jgi:hypothetical protein